MGLETKVSSNSYVTWEIYVIELNLSVLNYERGNRIVYLTRLI